MLPKTVTRIYAVMGRFGAESIGSRIAANLRKRLPELQNDPELRETIESAIRELGSSESRTRQLRESICAREPDRQPGASDGRGQSRADYAYGAREPRPAVRTIESGFESNRRRNHLDWIHVNGGLFGAFFGLLFALSRILSHNGPAILAHFHIGMWNNVKPAVGFTLPSAGVTFTLHRMLISQNGEDAILLSGWPAKAVSNNRGPVTYAPESKVARFAQLCASHSGPGVTACRGKPAAQENVSIGRLFSLGPALAALPALQLLLRAAARRAWPPSFSRSLASISSRDGGFAFSRSRAFSRPCPIRSPPYEYQAPSFSMMLCSDAISTSSPSFEMPVP